MSYLKDREIWLSSVPTGNPPAGYVWVFIQNGVFVVRDSSGVDKVMATTTGTVTNATSASYVEYSNVANKPALISGSSQVSYTGLSNIPSGIVSSSAQITGYNVFATTGSNQFNGSQAVTGSLTVTGQVVAQTLNVQQVTSSIVYSSGSNIFGNSLGNTQQFTGSVSVTGSQTIYGKVGIDALSSYAKFNISTGNDNQMSIGTTSVGQTAGIFLADGPSTSSVGYKWEFGKDINNDFFIYSYGTAGFPFKINYASGSATFSSSVTATNLYSSGNSGIGTSTPQSIANGISLTIGDSATQHQPYLAFRRNSTGGYWAGINWYDQTTRKSFIEENSDFDLRFGTSNTLRLTISSTGVATFSRAAMTNQASYDYQNIRVTSGFAGGYTDARIQSLLAGYDGNIYGVDIGYSYDSPSGAGYSLRFSTNDDLTGNPIERMRITSGGNVVIGNTVASNIGLTIYGSNAATIYQTANTGTGAGNGFYVGHTGDISYVWNYNNYPLVLATNNTERMRITSDGNVLIGETNPPSFSTPGSGKLLMLPNAVIVSGLLTFGPPYTQNIQIDIVYNNWGGNSVIGLVDMIITLREYANIGGTAFGKVFAVNNNYEATFTSFNTTNVTTSQCSVTATSGGNYTLRITIDPSNVTDRGSFYLTIPNAGGTGSTINSIVVSYV
jgi:hypothetical protein